MTKIPSRPNRNHVPRKRAPSKRAPRIRSARKFRIRDWLVAIAIIVLLARLIVWMGGDETANLAGNPRVVDGDSLSLNDERIRLWGIDAPELDQICRRDEKTYSCGQTAKDQLQSLIGKSQVTCQKQDIDKYGRTLAICSAAGVVLNQAMVESGWAVAYGGYVVDELKARSEKRGLWGGTFDQPRAWRGLNRGAFEEDASPDWLGQSIAFIRISISKLVAWFREELK